MVINTFTGTDGANPSAALIADPNGTLYGTTTTGGTSGLGTVFELAPSTTSKTGWVEKVLHNFRGGADGAGPVAALIADSSGILYGTTMTGGAAGFGTVFQLKPPSTGFTTWAESILYSFKAGKDGASPEASLVRDSSGTFYGTTYNGGSSSLGTVFRLTPPVSGKREWTETVLHTFGDSNDGSWPEAALISDSSGALYGTTATGGGVQGDGTPFYGTVFKLTPPTTLNATWKETVLYRFKGSLDGANPQAGLVAGPNGVLFGVTVAGGSLVYGNQSGTVFRLTPAPEGEDLWKEDVLHRFTYGGDGAFPAGTLITDASGTLYGTVEVGFQLGGTIFKLVPPAWGKSTWTESSLGMAGGADGTNSIGGLIADSQGTLYGTAMNGGSKNAGTVFKFVP